jgi:hypothetical protein
MPKPLGKILVAIEGEKVPGTFFGKGEERGILLFFTKTRMSPQGYGRL